MKRVNGEGDTPPVYAVTLAVQSHCPLSILQDTWEILPFLVVMQDIRYLLFSLWTLLVYLGAIRGDKTEDGFNTFVDSSVHPGGVHLGLDLDELSETLSEDWCWLYRMLDTRDRKLAYELVEDTLERLFGDVPIEFPELPLSQESLALLHNLLMEQGRSLCLASTTTETPDGYDQFFVVLQHCTRCQEEGDQGAMEEARNQAHALLDTFSLGDAAYDQAYITHFYALWLYSIIQLIHPWKTGPMVHRPSYLQFQTILERARAQTQPT